MRAGRLHHLPAANHHLTGFLTLNVAKIAQQLGSAHIRSASISGKAMTSNKPRYDDIGSGYARIRQEDPWVRDRIFRALGVARTIVNVGAGAGSYEPRDRYVLAIEPSDVMADQRPRELAPAIRATADRLPLRDGSVDAAMSVLSVHHWDEGRERGVRELRTVSTKSASCHWEFKPSCCAFSIRARYNAWAAPMYSAST